MNRKLLLLLALCCCFQSMKAAYVPVSIASGFNADIIANGVGAAANSSTPIDIPNMYAFVAADFQATAGDAVPDFAFPSNGLINSTATNGLNFQLANYSTDNALLLTETNNTGTLSFTATSVSDVYLLVSAANGSADFTATINFTDGSTQTMNGLTASDWFDNSDYAMKGVGRVNTGDNSLDGDADNPRVYQVRLQVDPPNYARTIASITFTANVTGDNTMAVMAVTTNSACNGTPAANSVVSTALNVCPNVNFTLSLANNITDGGQSFQWESSPDNTVWTPIAFAGTDANISTNQVAATYYHCIITCTVSGQSITSAAQLIGMNASNQCYCIPVYSTGCSDMFGGITDINSVHIVGENGTMIDNGGTGCSANNAYTDYSSTINPVSLTPYSNYTLSITTSSSSSLGNPFATAWIDLNDDGIFDDNTERVGTTGDNPGINLILNVPSAAVGNHRMRIRTVWNSSDVVNDPCGSYISGEAEDYSINLLPTPSCIHPMNLAAATVNQTNESFTWDAGASGTIYDYAVDVSGTANPDAASTINNTTANMATIAAVLPATTFYFHLRAHCSATDSSLWISIPFTLASTCANATAIAVDSTTIGNNSFYTDITLPANTCGNPADATFHGMWYKVTPTVSGIIAVYTIGGTSFDTYLRLYSGTCAGLSCNTFNDNYNGNASNLSFMATANTTYYILLTGSGSNDTGTYSLKVKQGPVNDEATGAILLTAGAGCTGVPFTNFGATASTGEPFPSCSNFAALQPVWFRFVAPPSGTARITTDYNVTDGMTDSRMGLFQASNVADYNTFSLISCDDDNGVTGAGQLSVIYATDLTPGATYYVEVDNGFSVPAEGTFCITVDELNSTMLSTDGVDCGDIQQPTGFNNTYAAWIPLADNNGHLVAIVRNPDGGIVAGYSGSYTVNTNPIRQDGSGTFYMDRNYFISNPAISTPVDVKLFFSQGEYGNLNGNSLASGSPATMSNLGAVKQEGSTCAADLDGSLGPVAALTQTANNSVNGLAWIQVNTSSFSNFYLMAGTTPLMIELKSIEANNIGAENKVSWSTATESVGDYFELERSADGKNFSFLTTMLTHQKPSDYVYYDNKPLANINYYRLKLISINGKTTYSKVVQATVLPDETPNVVVYPNPAGNYITLNVSGSSNGTVTLSDIIGKIIYQTTMQGAELKIDMHAWVSGIYFIHYVDDRLNKIIKLNKQ
jgi:hypothetical protein